MFLLARKKIESHPARFIFLLALTSRVVFLFVKSHFFSFGYDLDSRFYLDVALYLLDKHSFYSYSEAPLYTLFVAGSMAVLGRSVLALIGLQILLWSVTAVAAFHLAKVYFRDVRSAWVTGLLFAVDPFFVYLSSYILTENLAIPLIVLFFLCLVQAWEKGGRLRLVVAGLVLGAGILCRGVLAAFCPFLLLCGWFLDRSEGLKRALLILFVAGLTLVPWEVQLKRALGRPVFLQVHAGSQLYQSLLPYGVDYDSMIRWHTEIGTSEEEKRIRATHDELLFDDFYMQRAKQWIRANPGLSLQRSGEKMLDFWRPFPNPPYPKKVRLIIGVYVMAMYLLALVCLVKVRTRYHLFAGGLILSSALPFFVFFPCLRYRLPTQAILLLLAGGGLSRMVASRIRSGGDR